MPDPFFDTNIIIDWLKLRQPATIELARYRRHRISRIVWTEVLADEDLERRDRSVRRLPASMSSRLTSGLPKQRQTSAIASE